MSKNLRMAAAAALAFSFTTAGAVDPGWYVEGGLGYSKLNDSDATQETFGPGGPGGPGTPGTPGSGFLVIPGLINLFPTGPGAGGPGGPGGPGGFGNSQNFEIEYDDGAFGSLSLGYAWEGGFRSELQLRYSENDLDMINDGMGGNTDADGDITSTALMANAWFDFNPDGNWHPYVGGGLGAAEIELDAGGGAADDTVLAAQLGAGIEFDLSDTLALGLGYRFFKADDPEFEATDPATGNTQRTDVDYEQHSAMLSLRYVFAPAALTDSDGDGVPDVDDKCPNTPSGAPVDADGCPLDSDGDGVPDYADKCPNTPAGVPVDDTGCPLDSDGDGVPDYKDDCPNTPKGTQVNASGCPLVVDSDGDGVPDDRDKCPDTPPGQPVTTDGCAVGQSTVLQGVKFEFNSARLTPNAEQILIGVAETLKDSPGFDVEVGGHTDSIGSDSYNLELSQERTESAVEFLVGQGIDRSRMVARGYGESQPVAPNVNPDGSDNPEGRARNRRVELKVVGQR
ncbi:OmpA family protein [Salinisphaera sp. P385]|uniref:OmpA family protein n=1 Tax=Spectribacter acetivorans TaxID=3075603 RepID=A0ABU3BAG6_9GAMM|nr:OmpA family protein [Salinisphaera sp. P385]MDT0619448.1 OmpA family protein [Salinisphaera sp. P385]